jgi:NADPH:quinone reductase-like Zn-dependent oxidoreductase
MRVWEIATGSTSLEGLRRAERPDPKPGPREIVIRVRATSLNFRDQAVLTGNYFGGTVKRDTIPLCDGAGDVVETGADVRRFKPGDRAAGTFFQVWIDGPPRPDPSRAALGSPLDGTLAEYIAVHEDGAVHIPDTLTCEEAACLPCAGVTAWNALNCGKPMRAGETVLALGTGGVSTISIQLAKAAGCRVIVTSSSDEKIERAKALGATAGVNYRTRPDWDQGVLELTDGLGADHIVEVGGAGTLARSFRSLAMNGEVALIGVLSGREGDTNPHPLMMKGATMRGLFVGNRVMFEDLLRALVANKLRPAIDTVFPFEEAPEAFRRQASSALFGKVVIAV